MPAITTALDFSIANSLRARALVTQTHAQSKLRVLARLRQQYIANVLPRFTESNVEQSWNEQVFAHVLGYKTQFSHDHLPFNMKAKNYQKGYFSDFSLGFFGGRTDRVLATAELKGPKASLDAPQGAKYANLTPVQQAFRAARTEPDCAWVLISNFVELRVYDIRDDSRALARIDLTEVGDPRELAMFEALVGPRALLGDTRRRPELKIMMDPATDHPSSPLPAEEDHYRVLLRFTPQVEQELRLFEAEQALRTAVVKPPGWCGIFEPLDYGRGVDIRTRLSDGWVGIDGFSRTNGVAVRVAISLFGQIQASFRFGAPKTQLNGRSVHQIEFVWLLNALRYFAGLLDEIYTLAKTPGIYSAELREALDKFMTVDSAMLAPGAQNSGSSEISDIIAGDFRWDGTAMPVVEMAAVQACELAAYFRGSPGGIGTDFGKVKDRIDQMNALDRSKGC